MTLISALVQRWLLVVLCFGGALGVTGGVAGGALRAQDPAAGTTDPPARTEVEEALAAAEARAAGVPTEEVSTLQQVRTRLDALQAHVERRAALDGVIKRAAAEVAKLEARLVPGAAADPVDWQKVGDAELKARHATLAQQSARAQQEFEQAQQALTLRVARRTEAPQRLAEVEQALASLASATLTIPAEAGVQLRRALQWQRQARLAELEAERAALQLEEIGLQSEVVGRWRQLDADVAQTEYERLEREQSAVQAEQQRRRELAAQREEEAAKSQAEAAKGGHPLVELLSKQLATLAEEKSQITEAQADDADTIKALGGKRGKIDKELEALRMRFEAVGLTEAVGVILRQQAALARDAERQGAKALQSQERYGQSQLRLLDLDAQQDLLAQPMTVVERVAALGLLEPGLWPGGEVPEEAGDLRAVGDELERLFVEFEKDVEDLQQLHKDYSFQLTQLVAEAEALQFKARELLEFTNERVLWIRSAPRIWKPNGVAFVAGIRWLIAPTHWGDLFELLVTDAADHPVGWIAALMLFLAMWRLAQVGRRRIVALGQEAQKGATATFSMTVWAWWWSVVTSLPVPLVVFVLGRRFYDLGALGSFPAAAGEGLMAVAWGLSSWMFLIQVTRADGLAERHFRWNEGVLRLLRRNTGWAVLAASPLEWMLVTLEAHGNDPWRQSAGRAGLLALLLVLFVLLWKLLHPHRGLPAFQDQNRSTLWQRWSRGWFLLGVGLPVALAILSCLGYQYTAVSLVLRLLATVGLGFGVMIINGMVLRALALARRDLAMKQARERREAAKEAKATGEEPAEPTVDLGAVGQQMRSLLRGMLIMLLAVGAWFLWVDVLPALGFLREVVFWSETVVGVDGKNTVQRVTLASFLLATVYVLVTLLAAKNIGGLLELVILQRLSLKAGERNAVTTIARYIVLGVGFVLAFGAIGIGWSKVQWLAAALSVGLGFGLQEIFANFVSGLIILFERPVRVGDLVTVAGIDGTVSQIRIRSTVVTDYDRRELIIPNKEFITGSVTNWSLSDTISRVVLKVGVAYGTDSRRVRRVLLGCAAASPLVLDKPVPTALFVGFGASSLDFDLRVFIAAREDYVDLVNDLNTRIDEAFAKEGFEIPFPQRDLHLRSSMVPLGDLTGGGPKSSGGDSAAS